MLTTSTALPLPDPEAHQHSQTLVECIRQTITQQGKINFANYMELALYAPGLGYYSAGAQKFGINGDFITAPELSPLFSRCLAKQCQPILSTLTNADILELGAGSGIMAADLLLELEIRRSLPEHYYILEPSPELQQRQQHTLQEHIPHLKERIHWLSKLPESFSGIILANEVLDALPVHRFFITPTSIQEYYIDWQDKHFVWQLDAPSEPSVAAKLAQWRTEYFASATYPYTTEYNAYLTPWLNSLSDCLKQGLILMLDYGFPRHEYYHPDRREGTLMCHYRHRAHSDPLVLTGLQDITAHVDFTLLAESAQAANLEVAGYTTQSAFLLSCGITDLLQMHMDETQRFTLNQQIKRLTLPSEMGELFKVIGLTRAIDRPLQGFMLYDRRSFL